MNTIKVCIAIAQASERLGAKILESWHQKWTVTGFSSMSGGSFGIGSNKFELCARLQETRQLLVDKHSGVACRKCLPTFPAQ